MMICPKCCQVYGLSSERYCSSDGAKTLDTADPAAKPYIKRIMEANKKLLH